jgi:hypothetical protein
VYSHTFYFEHHEHAEQFAEEFKDWKDKGKT